MADWRYVHFEHQEAQRLADLNGVEYDLELVSSLGKQFLENDHFASSSNLLLAQAFFMSAVVTYGRTFGSSVRTGVTRAQIEELPENLQILHQYFKDVRDKFVAHSVNAFEENCVKLYLTPEERGGPGVASIGLGHARIATLSHQDMAHLLELVTAVSDLVQKEMESEKTRLLEFSRTLPIEDVYNYPEPRPFVGGSSPGQVRNRVGEG